MGIEDHYIFNNVPEISHNSPSFTYAVIENIFRKRLTELHNNIDYLERHNLENLAKESRYAMAIIRDLARDIHAAFFNYGR